MTNNKSFLETLEKLSPEDQETFLDELVVQMEEADRTYILNLDEDDALRLYHEYYVDNEPDEDDEEEPPLLFATVPMDGVVPKILNPDELVPVLTTVQVTGITGFGEVFVSTNLKPTTTRNVRVRYESLINYRSEVSVKFNP